MEKEKKKNIIMILLAVLSLTLMALCILLATGRVSFKAEQTCPVCEKSKTIADVVGKYVAKFDNLEGDGDVNSATITLSLYENGIFTYVYSQYAPVGVLGSYTVEDNKIILTNWFNTGSDVGLYVTKGTKILTINSDGNITDNNIKNKPLLNNAITTANLIKGESNLQFDLGNMLAGACLNPRADGSCGAPPSEPNM